MQLAVRTAVDAHINDDGTGLDHVSIDGFRGFLDCLEEPKECGTIYGVGGWKVGEINDKPSMHEAYEMGKKV